jgi:hypothetical protein
VREAYNDSLGDMINLDFSPARAAVDRTGKGRRLAQAKAK